MRSTRAYVAGFGTAGSLLAGAALLFVLASAVVSFRGWPQLDNHAAAPAIVLSRAPELQRSPATRRVALAAAAPVPSAGPASTPASAPSSAATTVVQQTTVVPGRHVIAVVVPRVRPTVTAPAIPASPAPSHTPSLPTLGKVVQSTGGAVGGTVTGAGSGLGSTVTGATGALGSTLGALSPAVGQTVTALGQALGSTVTGATNALGGTVQGATQALGGLLGSHP